ncbi:MAG: zeta toxin family protein [Clostridia bacterium]|nr:zeta toxin family protein [Clostridia bacterium]
MNYEESLENIKEKYVLSEKQFEEMYEKCKEISFHNCQKSSNPIAVFTGGQTGSGKGGIDVFSGREVQKNGEHMAVLDVDVYRATFPFTKEILKKYPTMYSDITAETTGKIVNKIINEAIKNNYNFVFEGTLRNTQPFETLKAMPDYYKKFIRVMAVSNVESLLTAFERNYEQIKLTGYGRFTNVETHNKTYNGVLNSIRTIESEKKDDIIIEIFKRGQDMVSPVKIYSSKDNDEKCASEILVEERERDKELNKKERSQRLKTLLETLEPKDEFEKKQVIKLKEELCFLL